MPTRNANTLERGGIPLYLQLAQILRGQIESGEYKVGDILPTEEQTSRDFGVSLITVREARRILADEGLISRQSGKGTFATQKPSPATYLVAPTIEDLIYGGQEHETRRECLERKILPANSRTAEILHVPAKSKVVEFRIKLYAAEAPLGYVVSTLPFPLGRHVCAKRLEEKPLVLLLSEICNIRCAEVEQWTTASVASKRTADMLGMRAGNPVLTIRRVFYDSDGHPVQSSVNIFRGDRFHHHVRLRWATLELKPR